MPDNPVCRPNARMSDRRWGKSVAAFGGVRPKADATGSAVAGRWVLLDVVMAHESEYHDVAAVERTKWDDVDWFGLVGCGIEWDWFGAAGLGIVGWVRSPSDRDVGDDGARVVDGAVSWVGVDDGIGPGMLNK